MSEAYEIGVTLALGDGVSASIAQARKDTAQLERVLQAGGVSVQQLRAASVVALSAIRAVPSVGKIAAKEPVPAQTAEDGSAVARVDVAPAVVPAWPQARDAAMPAKAAEPAVVAPQQGSAAIVPAVSERGAAPVAAAHGAPALAPQPLPPEPAWMAPQPLPAPQPAQAPQAAPVTASQSVLQVSAPISLATIGAAARDERPAPAPAGFDFGSARPVTALPAETPAAAVPDLRVPDTGGATGTAPQAWEQVSEPAWAPPGRGNDAGAAARMTGPLPSAAAAPERAVTGPQEGADAGASTQAPAAPPPAAANAGPTEGDVFLDGALVGRWISRFLSQEAGRASAGPTGFDPRRGRLLPGATVGG